MGTQIGQTDRRAREWCRRTVTAQVYRGMVDAARGIMAVHGVAGLYRGLSVTLLEIVPYAALQFGMYDALNVAVSAARRRAAAAEARARHHRVLVGGSLLCRAVAPPPAASSVSATPPRRPTQALRGCRAHRRPPTWMQALSGACTKPPCTGHGLQL